MRRWLLLLLVPVLAAPVIAFYTLRESAAGYFSPVYSPDGSEIYFISREAEALVAGLALDLISPRAPVYILRDRFALWKMPSRGGKRELVREWPPTPLERSWIRTARGRAFSTVQTHLRWSPEGQLEYMAAVTDPKEPPETWIVIRDWDPKSAEPGGHDDWRQEPASMTGLEEAAVWGDWEVLPVPGTETFPCAIATHNQATNEFQVVLKQPSCGATSWATLASQSHRSEVLRLQELRTAYERLVTEGMARGMSEGDALLWASHEMQEPGTTPR